MAVVYEVHDLVSGRVRALKRLEFNADVDSRSRGTQLFEREFYQLSQLTHPRVIQVYEYAIDAQGPYYTMDLVDGDDLQQLAPLDWRRSCAIARDICSALSLLHSRSLIHRDLSPRNVRCDADGFAKLIDFGALTTFGPSQLVIGTPACCAPEIVALQALDARTDLYALGATLYFMLTGRHAYPARQFPQLAELWRHPIVPPSEHVVAIPPALESLVLNLLRLDPDARPASAAEVMQRLSAIDGCKLDESLLVAQAYLSTPTLVGRAKALARTRARLTRVTLGESAAIAVEGPSGVGRSRFLDACVLEATLLGLTVVRIGADQAYAGDWGLVRSIAVELLERAPAVTREAAQPAFDVLRHALPELAAHGLDSMLPTIDSERSRALLQHALRHWLLRVCANVPLLIAVDDLQRIDEASATWLALLACELGAQPLVVIGALDTEAETSSGPACKLFAEHSLRLQLCALELADVEQLLRSLFGEAPNVDVLAHRLWHLAGGNPRQIMQLAQHMLDRGMVRYHAGAWSLPSAVGAADLVLSASDAQRARVTLLSPNALELARALALCADLDFSPDETIRLSGLAAHSSSAALLDELLRAEIVRSVRDHVTLAQPTWAAILIAEIGPDARTRLHLRLAETLAARGNQAFRVAQHYLLAGRLEPGLDLLVAHARASQEETSKGELVFLQYVRSLPRDWLHVFHWGVQLCAELKRPPRHRYDLLSRLIGIQAMLALEDKPHVAALMRELEQHSGLADWAALDPSLAALPRLQKALEQAQARYDQTPEVDRVLDPLSAIKQLARAMISASGIAASAMDVEAVRQMPSLEPLVPLSPALGLIQLLNRGIVARYTGRFEQASDFYRQILARLGQPDRGGLDVSHSVYTSRGVMNGLGMVEAGLGKASSLEYAAELEREPTHRVNALQIRVLYELWRGDGVSAHRYKHDVDRVRIENSARHWFEGSHLLWEIDAYTLCEDLMRLQHAREELAPLVARNPAWRAVDRYAAAHYHHSCGDLRRALLKAEQALALAAAGEHQSWPRMAALQLRILLDLGRGEQALALGERYLAEGSAAQLGYRCEYVRMALALAQAKLGQGARAVASADRTIAAFSADGITGLNLGWAYETRARVALQLRHAGDFKRFAEWTGEIYCAHRYPPLVAKFESLQRDGRNQLDEAVATARRSPEGLTGGRITAVIGAHSTPEARAATALRLLLEHNHAPSGFLFGLEGGRARCIACSGRDEPTTQLVDFAGTCLDEELALEAVTTQELSDRVAPGRAQWTAPDGRNYRSVMLCHYIRGALTISGVALLEVGDGVFAYPAQLATELSQYVNVADCTTLVRR